jgi:hypothetical protein
MYFLNNRINILFKKIKIYVFIYVILFFFFKTHAY